MKRHSKLDILFLGEAHPTECQLREIVGWLNDAAVVRFSEHRHKQHTLKTQLEYMASLSPTSLYWTISVNTTLIGTITAYSDANNGVSNVGIMLGNKDYWGMGWGFQAWKIMCAYLYQELKVRKIEAGCMAVNTGMMAICQKYGMVEEGRQEGHFIWDKGTADLVHWGKFNETS